MQNVLSPNKTKMKPIKPYILALSLFLSLSAWAQQDIQLSQQSFSKLNNNPAAIGFSNYAHAFLFARQQWLGFEGAPRTLVFNANGYLEDIRSGVGLSVTGDQVGRNTMMNIKAAYAYHVRVGRDQFVSLGLGAGVFGRHFGGDFSFEEPEIPEIVDLMNRRSRYKFDLDLGVMYSTPKLSLGLSATHISRYFFYAKPENNNWFNPPMNVFVFGEYGIDVGSNMKFTPRIQLTSVFSSGAISLYEQNFVGNDTLSFTQKVDLFYDVGGILELKDKFWIGVSFRGSSFKPGDGRSDALIGMVGINIGDNLRIGYAYDFKMGNTFRNVRTFGTHEIMLSYRMRLFEPENAADFTPRFFD